MEKTGNEPERASAWGRWVNKQGKWIIAGVAAVGVVVALWMVLSTAGYKTIDGKLVDYEIESDVLVADVAGDTVVVPIDKVKFRKGNAGVNKLKYEVKEGNGENRYKNVIWFVNKDYEDRVVNELQQKSGIALKLK